MITELNSFLDDWLPPLFAERPDSIAPWFYDYFVELSGAEGRLRYARALALDLKLAGFHPRGKRVLDAGSGFGVTLACLARLDAAACLGLEAFAPMAVSAGRLATRAGVPAHTIRGSVHGIPVPRASLDFIYCNEALSHFLEPHRFLAEASRTLAPGGKLMICDGNNGANPSTVAEVHEVWRAFEEGPGDREMHGHRIGLPYRQQRLAMITEAFPDQPESVRARMAWATFGRYGAQVVEEARRRLEADSLPESPPEISTCPVDPHKGDHIENLIYPDRLTRDLEELGFDVAVHAHFGGARSPLIEAANRVLRALTPVTLSRARSVKIVATRR